ncbi:hypothetical protein LOC67_06885 [Stieleria sp. JC731]|uniref:hypothetical protein n=1 Tax=Pirellulaceae TaxID=2691357 RepID=UPI001E5ED864|nr:hypothetical protein [Stieleria sp. JC731]MCC9600281.1 hypothetical protein [Stieleria sp. JC731]
MSEVDEIVQTISHLQRLFEDLAIRGLRTCGAEHLTVLRNLCDELNGIGAKYLGNSIDELIRSIENDDRAAASKLLRAQSTLRTFERVLTLQVAQQLLVSSTVSNQHC